MTSLAAVQATLKAADSDAAASLWALLDNNKVEGYRSGVRQRFGPSEADRPQLGAMFASISSSKIPDVQDLKGIFLRAFKETPEQFTNRNTYFEATTAQEDVNMVSDEDTVSQVVKYLRTLDTDFETANHVIIFLSQAVDEMCHDTSLKQDNVLHTSMTGCAIIPSNTPIKLQHSNEGTTTTTLLCGSMIWFIWPPTDHNLRTLQTAYEDYAEDLDMAKLDVTQDFKDGLMLVQSKGEGLRIPPFCPIISFTTKAAVIATSSTVTTENFISMLQKAPLLQAHFKTQSDGELQQTEFVASILHWLDCLLNGEIDNDTKSRDTTHKLTLTDGGPLRTLLSSWNDVKDGLAVMMDTTEEHETVKDIWSTFLSASKGRECKLCNKRVPKKLSLMREHFEGKHWPMDKVSERIDSMDVEDV